jgi:16S rRNA (guanine527-N7)-methyltransferase
VPNQSAFDLLNQHIAVSRETFERLSLYHDFLLKWQNKVNLISPDTIAHAWQRHFLDALQLLPLITNINAKIIDLGTGAGFPGMVLAIAGATNVHLIESDTKKILFLREVARITDTNVMLHHGRIEEKLTSPGDIITSRACSPLGTLLQLASNYVSHETICLFHKGKNYSKEIDDANIHWSFIPDIVESITDSQSAILKLTSIEKRDTSKRT